MIHSCLVCVCVCVGFDLFMHAGFNSQPVNIVSTFSIFGGTWDARKIA